MYKIPYFDYAAFVIFSIVAISIMLKGITRGRLNRHFLVVVVVALFATAFDIGAILFDNMGERHEAAQYFFHTGYLFFHGISTPLYVLYIINLVDRVHVFRSIKMCVLMAVPFVITAGLLGVNFFTPCVFSIGADGAYSREYLMFYLYLSAAFYIGVGLVEILRYRKRLSKICFASVITIFPIVVVAIIFQIFVPYVPVEMFANAIGILFVAMLIQSPEQLVNSTTGLGNIMRYMEDIKNSIDNEDDIVIVMISLVNNKTLRGMLGVKEYHRLLRELGERFALYTGQKKYYAEWYYLDNGMFRCMFKSGSRGKADGFASYVNDELKKGYHFHDMLISLIANICVVRCPQDIDDVDAVMRFGLELSDKEYSGQVLYAKDIFHKNHYDLMKDMDVIIDKAYSEGRFEVYYQPIYSIKDHRYNSAEALLRLHDDEYGFVPPDLFIPAAEKSGMIHKIGRFVLEEVCQFISGLEFKDMGLEYVEVNLSVMQCMSSELSEEVREVIEKYGVRPQQINLEITETAAAYAQSTMMDNIVRLTDGGIEFSLDDFGTGYSNMKRIASMPFSIVKLDKTFADLDGNDNMRKVVKDTIYMVKDMNMRIVVEGVETENSFEEFRELGVDYIQGYYFSKPLPKTQFVNEVFRINAV